MKLYKNEDFHKENFYNCYLHEGDDKGAIHTQDFYEITLTYSDNIIYHINGQTVSCPSGTLVFSHPGDEHCWRPSKGKAFSYFNLSFTPQTFKDILRFLDADDQRKYLESGLRMAQLSSLQTKTLVAKLKKINSVVYPNKKQKEYYVKTLLSQIFAEFLLQYEGSYELPKWLNEFCVWLKEDTNFACSLDDFAVKSGKSKEHLCRSFKKHLNVTVKEYVNDVRITYVASMLKHTDIPIIDLWLSAGFASGSYFSRLFKKKYNTTAKEYRKKHSAY